MAETMDGAREENGDIRLDPFMQPPILKALFKQLSPEDLAKCRLVCKLWYNESFLSSLHSNSTIKFQKDYINVRSNTTLAQFLDLWEAGQWASCPFKRFGLESWIFKTGDEDLEQQRFMQLVGSQITSLTLKECKFVERENFETIIYQAFPNLQFLKMIKCEVVNSAYQYYEQNEEITFYKEPAFGVHGLKSLHLSRYRLHSMMDMLSHFHKLENLHIEEGVGLSNYRNLLETIRLIRAQNCKKLLLKNFDVKFCLQWEQRDIAYSTTMELIRLHDQLNLPLQRLEIWFWPVKNINWNLNNKNVTRDLIQYHFPSLRSLRFHYNDRHRLCKAFPFGAHFEKLEELLVATPHFTNNLNYLRSAPNLRVLEIEDKSLSIAESNSLFSNSSELEMGDWALEWLSLTDLKLHFPVSTSNLRKLVRWMPNVELLSMVNLDDIKFSLVCNAWENLKDLKDCGTELTDECVLGIGNGDEEVQICPNITKLKHLTSFHANSSKLTSASVHDGFLKLSNLKWLSLGRLTKLDDETKAALESQKVKLYINMAS